jgi:hypothetical protein
MEAVGLCPDPTLNKEERGFMLRDYIYETLTSNNKNLTWYENGQYQGVTPSGYDSVNMYYSSTNIVFIFRKYTSEDHPLLDGQNSFTTLMIPKDNELKSLREIGNLLTDYARENYMQNNLSESTIINENTDTSNFKND